MISIKSLVSNYILQSLNDLYKVLVIFYSSIVLVNCLFDNFTTTDFYIFNTQYAITFKHNLVTYTIITVADIIQVFPFYFRQHFKLNIEHLQAELYDSSPT